MLDRDRASDYLEEFVTRDEALKIVHSVESRTFKYISMPEFYQAKGILEGYEQGVRDSAEICNKAKRWNRKQNRLESTKTSMELFGLILALLEVKKKKS